MVPQITLALPGKLLRHELRQTCTVNTLQLRQLEERPQLDKSGLGLCIELVHYILIAPI